jgi:glycosyltransferase involved in cell wall biosynthesis
MAMDTAMDMAGGNSLKKIKVLALTKFGRQGASSRIRSLQYLPLLQDAGIDVTVQALLPNAMLQARYESGSYSAALLLSCYAARIKALLGRHQFDVIWIEKEALPWMPLWLELLLLSGVPYVLDFDDAVFHNYDQHPNALVRSFFGQRLDGLMARSALVVGGNGYLTQRARQAGAKWVEVLPTVVDLGRYVVAATTRADFTIHTPRIVWIGSPTTVTYLQLLYAPLQTLAKSHSFVLRVIGGRGVEISGVQVEEVSWTEETEVARIGECDVGVMPLLDSMWERGKCGYKLIQYMACGLPVVASNVGVNSEIVQQGVNGFLASTPQEWVAALGNVLSDQALALQMGAEGRKRVEQTYCTSVAGPRLAELLRTVAERV